MKWKIAYAHHKDCRNEQYHTIEQIEKSEMEIVPARVPGCLELDLMNAGKMEDLYFSTNTLKAQKLEDVHVWYYTVLNITNPNQYLHFGGIDTFADIYINGKLVKSTDNMHLSYDIEPDWIVGQNEVVVHIKPTMLVARQYISPAVCYAQKYNYASLYVRKAAHMFGWDIMPRIVSVGLWKEVTLLEKKEDKIKEVYFATTKISGKAATVRFYINADLAGTFANEYTVKLEGHCRESSFVKEDRIWHNTHAFEFQVEDCKLWWPKNTGEQNLYHVTVTLLHGDHVCDVYRFNAGIRTIELDRTDITDDNGNGEFCFKVNGKKIFVLGTNWVPLDAFHSNDSNRLPKALALLDDIGCNMVRCWGGNVYESEAFFEFCDERGIMVWQDFALGCAVYPNDKEFAKRVEEEAVYQIKRLRNHASLALWAGDNECDVAIEWAGITRNPNWNRLTRDVLKNAVEIHDYSRAYLPSSPYVSENVFQGKGIKPEEHLWGPRDYFKGPYYKDTFCHFASETGYHGFNSPQSLKRFLNEPEKIFKEDDTATDEYLVHAASMDLNPESPYAYRIRLAYNQVVTLFGHAEESFADFVRQSQISQAEAKKYFIEKFRLGKWKRTGIIWWNLLDGWPQVSDAVVDYYFVKKLAYHYIRRSQQPICLMFDEPEDGNIRLFGVNDLPQDTSVSYKVKKVSGEGKEQQEVMMGNIMLSADSVVELGSLTVADEEKEFYLIEWNIDGKEFKNHYFTNIIHIDYKNYFNALKECGMDEFEGF